MLFKKEFFDIVSRCNIMKKEDRNSGAARVTVGDGGSFSRSDVLRMMPIPFHPEKHLVDPTFLKCDGKIISYESTFLGKSLVLLSSYYSVLAEWATWYHLIGLTGICFLTTFIVIASNSMASIEDNFVVVNEATILLSFVFAGYIGLVINRWDRIRNGTFGEF